MTHFDTLWRLPVGTFSKLSILFVSCSFRNLFCCFLYRFDTKLCVVVVDSFCPKTLWTFYSDSCWWFPGGSPLAPWLSALEQPRGTVLWFFQASCCSSSSGKWPQGSNMPSLPNPCLLVWRTWLRGICRSTPTLHGSSYRTPSIVESWEWRKNWNKYRKECKIQKWIKNLLSNNFM